MEFTFHSYDMKPHLGFPYLLFLVPALADQYRTREFRTLSSDSITTLTQLDPPEWTSLDTGHLSHLLIPRPSGSANNTLVQAYITSVFASLSWDVSTDRFTSSTPIGDVEFTNLIYTFDPSAPRKLVLSAHFDSKWFATFPQNQFIGATDSAGPCAMLLDLAEALTPMLRDRKMNTEGLETTLQIVFFDGEEAFHDWTDTDSIYGARWVGQRLR
jgi:glutaminyl-peptide cyclotransferase